MVDVYLTLNCNNDIFEMQHVFKEIQLTDGNIFNTKYYTNFGIHC